MKKFLFSVLIFALALGAGCKKKEVVVEAPPPPPPPEKQTEQEFVKSLVSMIPQLEPGKVLNVQINKERVVSGEVELSVSLFPLEFTPAEAKPYIAKYLFPSVVWWYDGQQLEVLDYPYFLNLTLPGEVVRILKESPNASKPFAHSPTLLIERKSGERQVLDKNGDEMPLR